MKKNTVFDFLSHIMVVWGISIMFLSIFVFLFGENAKELSSLYSMGKTAISIATLMQFLLLATMVTALRWLFLSDILIKQLSMLLRNIFMFVGIFIVGGIEAIIFEWFPMNQAKSWTMFLLSFIVCATVSICVSVAKDKNENRRLQEALERLKREDD